MSRRLSTVCPECERMSTRRRVTTQDYICFRCGWVGEHPKQAMRCCRATQKNPGDRRAKIEKVFLENPGYSQKQLAREADETLYMVQKYLGERRKQTDQAEAGFYSAASAPTNEHYEACHSHDVLPSNLMNHNSHGANALDTQNIR